MGADEPSVHPSTRVEDPGELLAGFLDGYRDAVLRKLDGLTDEQLRGSVLPSGWSPLGLVKHLTYMERRWLCWGFAGEDVGTVWGDSDPNDPDGPWYVADSDTADSLLAAFDEQAGRSRRILAAHGLTERAVPGPRFDGQEQVPTLGWILCHVLQEYARHVGQLDVVRELIDGGVGE